MNIDTFFANSILLFISITIYEIEFKFSQDSAPQGPDLANLMFLLECIGLLIRNLNLYNYKKEEMFIWHISDLHIRSGVHKDIIYAISQLLENIEKSEGNSIIVIAGDVFESKNKVSQYDLTCFHEIINILGKYKMIIIPGNHDYTGVGNLDLISAALINNTNPNVYMFKDSDVYHLEGINIDFHILSPMDELIPEVDQTKFNIAILHEPIKGCKLYGGIELNTARFDIEALSVYDLVLAGDIHKPQFLTNKIAYSGSLIQKNKGEDLNHGCIKWTLVDKTITSEFICFKTNRAYLKIIAMDDKLNVPKKELYNQVKYLEFKHVGCSKEKLEEFLEKVKARFGKINNIVDMNNNSKEIEEVKSIVEIPNQITLLKEELIDHPYSLEILELHAKLSEKLDPDYLKYKWKVNWIYWSNIFCYGEDNFLDFSKLSGIYSLIGKNKTGKSSIIDILIFILYNELLRGDRKSIIYNGAKGYKIVCSIYVDTEYIITKEGNQTKGNQVQSLSLLRKGDGWENISGADITSTYQIIKKLIGSWKDIVNVNISLQDTVFIVNKKPDDQVAEFRKYFNLDRLEKIELKIKDKLKKTKSELKALNIIDVPEYDLSKIEEQIKTNIETREKITKYKNVRMDAKDKLNKNLTPINILDTINVNINIDTDVKKLEADIKVYKIDLDLNMMDYVNIDVNILELKSRIIPRTDLHLYSNMDISSEIDIKKNNIKPTVYKLENLNVYVDVNEYEQHLKELNELKIHVYKLVLYPVDNSLKLDIYINKLEAATELETNIKNIINLNKSITHTRYTENDILNININLDKSAERIQLLEKCIYNYKTSNKLRITNILMEEIVNYFKDNEYIPTDELKIDENFNPEYIYTEVDMSVKELKELKSILKDKLNVKIARQLKFTSSCDSCKYNKNILTIDDKEIRTKIEIVSNKLDIHKRNEIYLNNIDKYKQNIKIKKNKDMYNDYIYFQDLEFEKNTKELNDINKALEILGEKDLILANIKYKNDISLSEIRIEELKTEIKLAENLENYTKNLKTEEDLRISNIKILELEAKTKIMAKNIEILKEKDIILNNIKLENEIKELKTILEQIKIKELIDKYETSIKIKLKIDDLYKIIEETELIIKSVNYMKKIESNRKINEKLDKLIPELEKAELALIDTNNILNKLEIMKVTVINYEKVKDKQAILERKKAIYDKYLDCINMKTGLPYKILKTSCFNIETSINKILDEITDFKITLGFDLKKFQIQIVDKFNIPAEQGSGFQKFIIDLSMKLCLASGHPYLPNFFIVDEGFGCMDNEHLLATREFLEKLNLKNNFDWIIVISHIEELSNITKNHLVIESDGDKSKLSFGIIPKFPKATSVIKAVVKDIFIENMEENTLYCKCCKKNLKLTLINRQKHIITKLHIKNMEKYMG